MSVIDVKTCYAINYPLDCDNPWQEALTLQYSNMIYLYFILPPCCSVCTIQKAELILSQNPCASWSRAISENKHSGIDSYALYPLLKPMNIYYRLAPIDIDYERCITFQVPRQQEYAEIDITQICQGWISRKWGNSGLLLTGSTRSQEVAFASGQFALPWMRPMLRLTCECVEVQSELCSVPCDVKVTSPS